MNILIFQNYLLLFTFVVSSIFAVSSVYAVGNITNLTLAPSSDTGTKNDNITNNPNPSFMATFPEGTAGYLLRFEEYSSEDGEYFALTNFTLRPISSGVQTFTFPHPADGAPSFLAGNFISFENLRIGICAVETGHTTTSTECGGGVGVSPSQTTYDYKIDTTPPTVTIAPPTFSSTAVTFSTNFVGTRGGSSDLDTSSLKYKITSNNNVENCNTTTDGTLSSFTNNLALTVPIAGNANNFVCFSGADTAGNTIAAISNSITNIITPNAPIIIPTNQVVNNSVFTLKGTAEANSTITLTQNGNILSQGQSTSSTGAWSFPVTLISGENTFTATATNGLNFVSIPSSQSIITVEFLPPEFNVIPFVNDSNYTVRGFVQDENATITLTQNGNVLSAAIEPTLTRTIPGRVRNGVVTNSVVRKVRPYWSYDVTLIDGINTFVATATSADGTAVSSSTTVTLDTVAPIITLTNQTIELEAGLSTIPEGLSASIGVSTDDGSRITISGYGDVFRNKGNPGDYNVIYNSRDDAGNAATPVTRIYRIIDTTSPVITLQKEISIAQGSSYIDGGVTLVDNDVTYAAGIRRKDSNGLPVCPFTQTTNCYTQNPATFSSTGTVDTSTLGKYTITYSAPNDKLGNSVDSVTRTVYVIPATTPTSIAEKSLVLNGITKTITVKTDISVPSNQINAFEAESYTDTDTIALIYDKTNVKTRDENEIFISLKSNERIRILEDSATYIKVNHDACSENNNCEVVLQYTSSNLKSLGNIDPSSLTIFHFNSENNKWEELKNIVVNIAEKTITGSIGSFSPFIIGTLHTKKSSGGGFIPRQGIGSTPLKAPSIKGQDIQTIVSPTVTSITTLPTITNFVTPFGQNGNDIISLQRTLNLTTCKVSVTGAGSKGLETNYFGNKTRNAIKCLQQQYQLPITGVMSLETQTILQIIQKIEKIKTLIQIKLQDIQG